MYNYSYEKLGLDYIYVALDVKEDEMEQAINAMRLFNMKGGNVTMPGKNVAVKYMDELSPAAELIGAVNTIVNKNGRLIGHNTDFSGFEYMVRSNHIEISEKKALVLGTGGASAAILDVLNKLGASSIVSVSRTGKGGAVTYKECIACHTDAEVIVNTTPVGMYPAVDASPLDLTPFTSCRAVLDVIYNPGETKLTAQAKALGMKGITGLSMLVAQAKYACEFFLETTIDDAVIDKITEEIASSMYR